MAHDVFISHSAKDHAVANEVCAKLEKENIRCWIAPRDIMPGMDWGEAIIDGIGDSRLMILVFSSNANNSRPTKREVERADHHNMRVIPFRIENVAPSKSLELFISTSHWLDAFTPPLEQHLQRLAEVVKRQLALLDKHEKKPDLQAALAKRYVFEREIGRGGTATVYLARDLRNKRAVAIKALNSEIAHALGADRFLREIEIAANLNHPRILPLFDSGEAGGALYYVMPYVEGESLQQRLRRERQLPEEDALRIAVEVASALSYAHSRGVVHRDIKPGNILLSGGEAVVADFGIARAISVAKGEDLTEAGLVIGTPVYMSPEQAAGERHVDGRSDIYSLGCVLFEMLAGEPPFSGPSAQAINIKRLSPAPGLRRIRPTISVTVEQAVAKALAPVPADRFATVAEFARAVTRAAERATEAVSISIAPPPAIVEAGDSFRLNASVRSAAGIDLPGREVIWTSSDPTVASVDVSPGLMKAVAPGLVTLTASAEGARCSVELTVMAPRVAAVHLSVPPETLYVGDHVQLTATLQDKHGALLSRPVSWSSSEVSVASVSSTGLVTVKTQGAAVIAAQAEGVSARARLRVNPAPVADVCLSAPPQSVMVGETFTLTATGLDPRDNRLDDRRVTWKSSDRSIAAVSPGGIVTAHAPGSVTLTATCEGKSASAAVTVTPAPVASVTLSRPPKSISVGRKFILKASPRDIGGRVLKRGVEWKSRDPAVAEVSRDGIITARTPGEAVITATADGVEGTVRLTVSPAVALAERVTPGAAWIANFPKWWWTVVAAAAAVLLFWIFFPFAADRPRPDAAPRAGRAPDTMRPDTLSPEVAGNDAVAAVSVSNPPARIEVGDTFTLAATVRDGLGTLLETHAVRWHSSAPSVAAVSESTGTVTARAAGSAIIVAESQARRDSVPVQVRRAAVAAVIITQSPLQPVQAGSSVFMGAEVRDARNRPIHGRKMTWVSSDPRVARVDASTGRVTALAPGSTTITAVSERRRDSLRVVVASAAPPPAPDNAQSPLPRPKEVPRHTASDTGKQPATDGNQPLDTAAALSEIRAIIERQRRATELQDLELALREVSPAVGEELKSGFELLREVKDITSNVTQVKIQLEDTARARASFHDVITVTRKSTGRRLVLFNGFLEYSLTRTGERWIITSSARAP